MDALSAAVKVVGNHLFILNLALNAFGIWRTCSMMRQSHRRMTERRRQRLERSLAISTPVGSQAMLVGLLQEKCEDLAAVNEQQRAMLVKLSNELQALKHGEACGQGANEEGLGQDDTEQHLPTCPVCWCDKREVAFQCGHITCEKCSLMVQDCPICRTPLKARIKLFL